MKLNYQSHQRDYSVLGTSVVFNQLQSKDLEKRSGFHWNPFYILVEKGIFYYYLVENDLKKFSNGWFKCQGSKGLKKFIDVEFARLKEFNKFLTTKSSDPLLDLVVLHKWMAYFTEIIFLSAYLPIYYQYLKESEKKLLLRSRIKFENVHKLSFSYESDLLARIERQRQIKKGSMIYMTNSELKRFLSSSIIPNNLSKRKDFLLLRIKDQKFTFYNRKKFYFELKKKPVKEKMFLRGSIAYPGKTKGIVKIIRKMNDLNKLNKNEILIASMTDPRYLLVMKKAAAIITNEGGITCHAAIVSRELKKPCIIGTKIATHIFKNGDRVEVDANKGIIRKL